MLNYLKKSRQILGLNARNLNYIATANFKKAKAIADNKLQAKKVLNRHGIPTPHTFAVIKTRQELKKFNWHQLPDSFALKPNRGLGGEGILIVFGKKKNPPLCWVKANKSLIWPQDLEQHILNILEGSFSLASLPDMAFFEERIKIHPALKPYCFRGIPDIRIIVYNKVPIMAELRLPTQESDGRANLHQGGIGVGIDMASGRTTFAIQYDKLIEAVPNTRLLLRNLSIPHWHESLEMASECQLVSQLGFMGVDITMDRERGPVVLELNARPGLAIQIANLAPLKTRLEKAEGLKVKTTAQALRLAKDLFATAPEGPEPALPDKPVVGFIEPIELISLDGKKYKITAKIDTGAYHSAICQTWSDKLGLDKTIVSEKKVRAALGKEERPLAKISFILKKKLISTEAFIADRTDMKYDVIIGRRDIKQFLVDPNKRTLNQEEKGIQP